MSKKLVTYFSATGTTANVASMLADAVGADIHEIRPKFPYSKVDLNWMDKQSRSTIEMNNKAFRPEIEHSDLKLEMYDVIFLGFPIWWWLQRSSTHSWRATTSPERKSSCLQLPAAASSARQLKN